MKLAIVGLGSIGRRHLGNFHAIGVETLAAYDADPAQRAEAATQFPFATVTATLEAALDAAAGVGGGTPPHSNLGLARLGAGRGANLMAANPSALPARGV